MSVYGTINSNNKVIVDPWDFQDPAAYPPAPCRTIEITDEIRAKDAAEQAAREARDRPWTIRGTLSVANLRQAKPKKLTPAPSPTARTPRPAKPARSTHAPSTPKETRKQPMENQTCKGGCGTPLSAYLISKGKEYANGHQDGCPSPAAPAAKPSKLAVTVKVTHKPGIDGTLAFAKHNLAATDSKIDQLIELRDKCVAEIAVEMRHQAVLAKLIADLDAALNPVAEMVIAEAPRDLGDAGDDLAAATAEHPSEFVDETAYEAEAA